MRSRPRQLSWTSPVSPRICRCLVMAWRVMAEPVVSRVIDCGPSTLSRFTKARRVSSPSAAKSGAACARWPLPALRRDILGDMCELLGPALLVHAEGDDPPRRRKAIEAGLDHRELRAVCHVGEVEFDEGHRLGGIVHAGLTGIGGPAVGEQVLGLNPLDHDLQGQVLVAEAGEAAHEARARRERALQGHTEPGAELVRLGEGAPDARAWRAQGDGLLDAVRWSVAAFCAHTQPPRCILPCVANKCKCPVALSCDVAMARAVRSRFVTMDVAQRRDGEWFIVELGDGRVAGLPGAAAIHAFYSSLGHCIRWER